MPISMLPSLAQEWPAALAWQAMGRRFESAMLHLKIKFKIRMAVPLWTAILMREKAWTTCPNPA